MKMKAIMFIEESLGAEYEVVDIPSDLLPLTQKYRTEMLEAVSDVDDTLLEKYLEGKEISEEEIKNVLRQATIQGKIIPVLCGSSFKNKGVQQLLDAVVDFLPSPLDSGSLSAHHIFKNDHVERKIAPDEKFAALAFKIMTDPYVGKLTFIRVYTGELKAGSYIFNSVSDKKKELVVFFKCMLTQEKI